MKNRGAGEVDVEGVEDITDQRPEEPRASQLGAGVERHSTQRDKHVRDREADDVVVGDDAQLSVAVNRDDDESVPKQRSEDDGDEDEPLEEKGDGVQGVGRGRRQR